MLVLTRSDVAELLSMATAIDAVARGAREYSEGRGSLPPRTQVPVAEAPGTAMYMPGYLSTVGALGVKIIGSYPDNPVRGLPYSMGLLLYQDWQTGAPLALMEATYLTDIRTGALTGLASRYLARPESKVVTIIGSGAQARTQLLALAEVLPLECAFIWSRSQANVEAYLDEMRPRLPAVRLEMAEARDRATQHSDVVITATSSTEPVLFGEWLQPGTFVASVGHPTTGREIDESVVRRAAVVAVDTRRGALHETHDLGKPLEAGLLHELQVEELGELVAGSRQGRRSPEEITLFKSVGFAAADLVCAQTVYLLARARGLGTEVKLDQ